MTWMIVITILGIIIAGAIWLVLDYFFDWIVVLIGETLFFAVTISVFAVKAMRKR